ncbi:MAG: SDR family NAD(P)-dependent oxidoreductase [Jhaorihella sp.]
MGALTGRHLFILGLGYSAAAVAERAMAAGARVSGTTRDADRAALLCASGIEAIRLDAGEKLPADRLDGVSDLLISIPPGPEGCTGLAMARDALAHPQPGSGPGWIGYLSSTAVYGDCGGDWIDETRAPAPLGRDARGRLMAEAQWQAQADRLGAGFDILRIAGIYGPGRNILARLRAGDARAILKPGQYFNRIHRDDIAGAVLAAMRDRKGTRITNLSDGAPCPASEVMFGVAGMLGLPRPESIAFDDAGLPPGAAGFYAENRRLRNERLLSLPGFALNHPDWKTGYAAILAAERGA